MFQVLHVSPRVLMTGWPPEAPYSVDHRVLPAAHEVMTFDTHELTLPIIGIVPPHAQVLCPVCPHVDTKPRLASGVKLPPILRTACHAFDTAAMRQVTEKLAPVGHRPITVTVKSHARCAVAAPLANVAATVRVNKAAGTMRTALTPLALIAHTVTPTLNAKAMSILPLPFPFVDGTRSEVALAPPNLLRVSRRGFCGKTRAPAGDCRR
mmetsp:Transcript_7615/g.14166  ORF Transcript_7615/g.14166 Transcript_7615/m.14166 type:complete len:209 (-) Transcript_7615:479-1105(-)